MVDPSDNEEFPIILLDLETSGFAGDCDILQIAAKCGTAIFETYVNPTEPIPPCASEINGLTTNWDGVLMYKGKPVPSLPLRIALINLHKWLTSFGKQCYIATHNLSFDGPRLYNAITSCSFGDEFRNVICGFIDTLSVIRKKTERRGRGECSIKGLAEWLNVSVDDAHNAVYDVEILDEILPRANITYESLIVGAKSYSEQIEIWENNKHTKKLIQPLCPLEGTVGKEILLKMANASITIKDLHDVYGTDGRSGIEQLLSQENDGKPLVTNRQVSITKIVEWLEKQRAAFQAMETWLESMSNDQ